MGRSQKVWQVLACLLVVAWVVSGCRGRSTPPPEPHTIQFILYDHPREMLTSYQQLAEKFHEENPELTVDVQPVSGSSALQAALSSGADVVLSWGWAIRDVGDLRPLDPFIEAEPADFLKDYLPKALESVRYHGQTIALPADLDVLVVYYNKQLFDEAGVPYPTPGWTWSDFVALAQALTKPLPDGGKQYGFYPSDALPGYLPFIAQELSALWGDDLLNPQKLRLDSEPVKRAVQWYADLALSYGVMPTPAEQRKITLDPILLGRAGMWLGWMSDRGGQQGIVKWKFPWGVALLPRGSTGHTIMLMDMYVIPTSSQYPRDAWRWISFLSHHTEQNAGLPVRQSLLNDAKFRERVGPERLDVFVQAAQNGILVAPGAEFEVYARALDRAMREIMEGGRPVEDALRDAQRQVDAAIQ
ncbi:MAG: sugar ABC transporter substrate-binding protein [Anaerolineae bacterium]|nr:sugar ABC transporter substrate-binding protein [Anaerolineae bacterium]